MAQDHVTFWLTMLAIVVVICVFIERIISGRGTGARSVQLVSAVTFLAVVAILAIMDKLDSATTSALLGAFAGFVFGGLVKFDERSK